MKTLFYTLCFLGFDATALQPGDTLVREVKQTSRSGDVTIGTITLTVQKIDEAGDRLECLQEESLGRVKRENVVVSSLAREISLANGLTNLDGYCQENGGEVEDVVLPTGSVRACKLATSLDAGVAGYRWYAPVGFTNVVKEVLRAEDTSQTETLLQSVNSSP